MRFRGNILLFVLVLLTILCVGASYVRFMVLHDYTVAYEGICDPGTHDCFIGCEDEECTAEYYYMHVEKYAPALYEECGFDITDCDAANSCLAKNDEDCAIIYCDPDLDGELCESLTEADVYEMAIEEDDSDTTDI